MSVFAKFGGCVSRLFLLLGHLYFMLAFDQAFWNLMVNRWKSYKLRCKLNYA